MSMTLELESVGEWWHDGLTETKKRGDGGMLIFLLLAWLL